MKRLIIAKTLSIAFLLGGAALIAGCGSTDSNSSENNFDGTTATNDDSIGKIEVKVKDTTLQVAQTAGFEVNVTDAKGRAVPGMRIACDSEAGVAIIEPSNGIETTDEGGHVSGKIGCELVGSYLFGCRLSVGANKRQLVTMKCSGPIPADFNGFPGSGGGNLGGNNSDTQTGATIQNVLMFDAGNTSRTSGSKSDLEVDVVQGACGTAPNLTPEPFYDSVLGIEVKNDTDYNINFNSFSYKVINFDGSGSNFQSSTLAPINADEVPARSNSTTPGSYQYLVYFAKAGSGGKTFVGGSSQIGQVGFKNVEVKLEGTNSRGDTVTITKRVAISFDNYNRC